MKKGQVQKIAAKMKLQILHRVMSNIHEYDGRFDANHVISIEDIVQVIANTELPDRFIEDLTTK